MLDRLRWAAKGHFVDLLNGGSETNLVHPVVIQPADPPIGASGGGAGTIGHPISRTPRDGSPAGADPAPTVTTRAATWLDDWRAAHPVDVAHRAGGIFKGGSGTITLPHPRLENGSATINGTAGDDFVHVAGDGLAVPSGHTDIATATSGNDTIDVSQGGNDSVYSGGGDDTITIGIHYASGDTIDGGGGTDRVIVDLSATPWTVNLSTGYETTLSSAGGPNLLLVNIESIDIKCGSDNDSVYDLAGNDRIDGGGGNDIIRSSSGADTLFGGGGDDAFLIGTNPCAIDGGSGDDKLLAYLEGSAPVTLTFVAGAAGSLPNGTTYDSIEVLNLTTESGDDTITFRGMSANYLGAGTSWDAGSGTDKAIIDISGLTQVVSALDAGGNYQIYSTVTNYIIISVSFVEKLDIAFGSGNDFIAAHHGTNVFDGGAGYDTMNMSGQLSDYSYYYDAGTGKFHIDDLRPDTPSGSNTISNIERLRFSDGMGLAIDTSNTLPWTIITTLADADRSIAKQIISADNGTTWENAYDTTNADAWLWTSTHYDASHRAISQTGTNDDGTHWLNIYFTSGSPYDYVTISFDANWSETAVTGVNGSGAVAVSRMSIAAEFDTALWFATPYDADAGAQQGTPLSGGDNIDILYGFAGSDALNGAGGQDILVGGLGNDTLTGGADGDTFIFSNGDGIDTIIDFTAGSAGSDVIDLRGYGITSFAELQSLMHQSFADTVITFDPANQIILDGVAKSSLNAGDFLFH